MAVPVSQLCQEHNITVEQLAELSGLETGRVTAIVLGRWTPSPTERAKVAAAFDVAVQDIAWGHRTPVQHLYGQGPA